MAKSRWFLIWSYEHQGWWGNDSVGYVENLKLAGRYTKAQAESICEKANEFSSMKLSEVYIPEWAVIPEVHAPSCGCDECEYAAIDKLR